MVEFQGWPWNFFSVHCSLFFLFFSMRICFFRSEESIEGRKEGSRAWQIHFPWSHLWSFLSYHFCMGELEAEFSKGKDQCWFWDWKNKPCSRVLSIIYFVIGICLRLPAVRSSDLCVRNPSFGAFPSSDIEEEVFFYSGKEVSCQASTEKSSTESSYLLDRQTGGQVGKWAKGNEAATLLSPAVSGINASPGCTHVVVSMRRTSFGVFSSVV